MTQQKRTKKEKEQEEFRNLTELQELTFGTAVAKTVDIDKVTQRIRSLYNQYKP